MAVAVRSSSPGSSEVVTVPWICTNPYGGCSRSTHMATLGSRAKALPLAVRAPVLNTISSSSTTNQMGATTGRPSGATNASLPVLVPWVRNSRTRSSESEAMDLTLTPPRAAGRDRERGERHVAQHRSRARGGRRARAVRGGVQQAEDRVRAHPGLLLRQLGQQTAQHGHPHLDVLALGAANLPSGLRWQVVQVAVLDADEFGFAEGEVQMEVHQGGQRGGRVVAPAQIRLVDGPAAREQPAAHADQQLDQQRFLAGEVPVDGGPADPDGRAQIVEPHAEEPALGDQARARLEQLPAPFGFQLASARADGGLGLDHVSPPTSSPGANPGQLG